VVLEKGYAEEPWNALREGTFQPVSPVLGMVSGWFSSLERGEAIYSNT
jgi:hypothetical protein